MPTYNLPKLWRQQELTMLHYQVGNSTTVDDIEKQALGNPKIVDLTVEAYRLIVEDVPFTPTGARSADYSLQYCNTKISKF